MAKSKDTYLSPLGEIWWANLIRPARFYKEKGERKEISGGGRYRASLIVDAKDWEPIEKNLVDGLNAWAKEEGIKKLNDFPWEPHMDEDGKETGKVVVKFSQRATIQISDDETVKINPPTIVDSEKNKLFDPNKPDTYPEWSIGNTSEGSVVFTPYYNPVGGKAGMRLRPIGVQLTKLEKFIPDGSSANAVVDMFEPKEGGYVADAEGADDILF